MNKFATKLSMTMALLLCSGFGITPAAAATVTGTAELLSLTTSGALIDYTDYFFNQTAIIDDSIGESNTDTLPLQINAAIPSGQATANSLVAGTGIGFLPHSDININSNGGGIDSKALSFVVWTLNYTAVESGTVTVDFEYLYNATISNLQANEFAQIDTRVSALWENDPTSFQDVTAFSLGNTNYQDGNTGDFVLSFNVSAGDVGSISFSVSNEGVLTTPVPLPAAVWLFCSALFGMVRLRRRKP